MLLSSPNVPDAILLHGIVRATMYVPNTGPDRGRLLVVHAAKTVEDAFACLEEFSGRIAVVVVDVESLGKQAGVKAVMELQRSSAMADVPLAVWVSDERLAAHFGGPGLLAVRRPFAPEDRYAQIGRMIAAHRAGGSDELRTALADSIVQPGDSH